MEQTTKRNLIAPCSLYLHDKLDYTLEMIKEQLHDLIDNLYITNTLTGQHIDGTHEEAIDLRTIKEITIITTLK